LQIAVGSSTQVALFVAPALVFLSLLFGHEHPLDLHFTLLEVAALLLSVFVVALVCHDGEDALAGGGDAPGRVRDLRAGVLPPAADDGASLNTPSEPERQRAFLARHGRVKGRSAFGLLTVTCSRGIV